MIDVRYAAALIDGEGCLSISGTAGGSMAARVDIGMTMKAERLLKQMQATFGGSIRNTRAATEKWDAAIAWALFGWEAIRFVRLIAPHLVLKREQAELLVRLQAMIDALPPLRRGTKAWTKEALRKAATMKLYMHVLNRKGPPPKTKPSSEAPFAQLVGRHWTSLQADLFSNHGWAPYLGRWPRSGTMLSGRAYARATWVPRIDVTASSSSLGWPTPTASDSDRGGGRGTKAEGGPGLQEATRRLWPTATAGDAKASGSRNTADSKAHPGVSLTDAIRQDGGTGRLTEGADRAAPALNPAWVEALMGFPPGWTSVDGPPAPAKSSRRGSRRVRSAAPKAEDGTPPSPMNSATEEPVSKLSGTPSSLPSPKLSGDG